MNHRIGEQSFSLCIRLHELDLQKQTKQKQINKQKQTKSIFFSAFVDGSFFLTIKFEMIQAKGILSLQTSSA